jgi:hypothetical protein
MPVPLRPQSDTSHRSLCAKARRRAHRGDGFVECRENPRLADRRCDVMSVHVGPKVPTDREDHADPLARQLIEQIAHGLRGGVVYMGDRACIDDEPADGRRRAIHEGRKPV